MVNAPTLKIGKQELWQIVRRELVRPSVIIPILFTFTLQLWVVPVSYFMVWTYTFAPSGWIPRTLLAGLTALSLWGFGSFLSSVSRISRLTRPYRKAARAGDQDAIAKMIELRSCRPKINRIVLAHASVALLIPILVAIIFVSGDDGGLYLIKDHGKLRHSTRQEDLQMKLKALQKHGVFKPMSHSE